MRRAEIAMSRKEALHLIHAATKIAEQSNHNNKQNTYTQDWPMNMKDVNSTVDDVLSYLEDLEELAGTYLDKASRTEAPSLEMIDKVAKAVYEENGTALESMYFEAARHIPSVAAKVVLREDMKSHVMNNLRSRVMECHRNLFKQEEAQDE